MARDLISKLIHYHPMSEEDAQQADRIIDFLRQQKRAFERGLLVGHITASAWIVNAPGTHVLLTHHQKLGKWLQLGGHADGDTDVSNVALREAREESGLTQIKSLSDEIFDVDIHLIPATDHEPSHYHYDIRFLFQADMKEPLQKSSESTDLAWVAMNRLETLTAEPSILRMRTKWESRMNQIV